MESKLLKFIEDFDEFVYDILSDETFVIRSPICYITDGGIEYLEFKKDFIFDDRNTIYNYRDMLDKIKENSEAWSELHKLMEEFFSKMSNEEIEEKYEIGIEEE